MAFRCPRRRRQPSLWRHGLADGECRHSPRAHAAPRRHSYSMRQRPCPGRLVFPGQGALYRQEGGMVYYSNLETLPALGYPFPVSRAFSRKGRVLLKQQITIKDIGRMPCLLIGRRVRGNVRSVTPLSIPCWPTAPRLSDCFIRQKLEEACGSTLVSCKLNCSSTVNHSTQIS